MKLDKILKLGNPKLYELSKPVEQKELEEVKFVVSELHDILMEFRAKYNAGRAIAAPQVGVMKRMIYLHVDKPVVLINPVLYDKSEEMFEVWDDCLCFPDLLVKVLRHKRCKIKFLDFNWEENIWELEGDLAELLQHEYDHLDGILAIQKAIDLKAFAWRSEIPNLK